MSELRLDTWTMPAADLGPENPLPPMHSFRNASSAELPEGERGNMPPDYPDKGQENNPLPYRIQDGYTRTRRPRKFTTAVLENKFLRATFLLELGGRLWSLVHKPTGRELLHVNPVFQPANLAIRNAWFTGGVEWNVGIFGHSPLTCSPLFAARVAGGRGPGMHAGVAALTNLSRVRRMPFQIDCWLEDDKPVLMVRGRLINPHDYYLPMYWWSNIAVDEKPDVRVIGPAESGIRHDYKGGMVNQRLPMLDGIDITYATNRPSADDLYFHDSRKPPSHAWRRWMGRARAFPVTTTSRMYAAASSGRGA